MSSPLFLIFMDADETPSNRGFDIEKFLEGDSAEVTKRKLRLVLDFLTKEQLVSFVHRGAESLPKDRLESSIYRMLELDDIQGHLDR